LTAPRRIGYWLVETCPGLLVAAASPLSRTRERATRFDVTIQEGKVSSYRVRLDISFKYEN